MHDSAWGEGISDHMYRRNAGADLLGEVGVR
jgi:hypothetical protein